MSLSSAELEDLRCAAESPDPEVRGLAMQALLKGVRRDASLQQAVLPIFRAVLADETHAWAGVLAARGVEHIEGPIAAREVWLDLLGRQPPQLVRNVAFSLVDPFYVPALIELLHRRAEPDVRGSVIRALGSIKDPAVLSAIAEYIDDPLLRADVLEALGDQGDRRSIPLLETVLEDDTETGRWDDRGSPIRMRYLAWDSIRRMNEPDFDRLYRHVTWQPFDQEYTGNPVPPELEPPYRPAQPPSASPVSAAPPAPSTPSSSKAHETPLPPSSSSHGVRNIAPPTSRVPPTSRHVAAPPTSPVVPATAPGVGAGEVRGKRGGRRFRLIALLPLGFAVVEFVWAIFLLILVADSKGEIIKTRAQTHTLDAVGMIPGVIGILVAIALILTGRARIWLELICVIIGLLLCLPFVYAFGYELMLP